jgi:hypothetical protein
MAGAAKSSVQAASARLAAVRKRKDFLLMPVLLHKWSGEN